MANLDSLLSEIAGLNFMLCVPMDVSHKTRQVISMLTDFVFKNGSGKKVDKYRTDLNGVPDAPRQEGVPLSTAAKLSEGKEGRNVLSYP